METADSTTDLDGDELAPLWRAAQAGESSAFESLYRESVGAVYGLCLRMTANPALAEDCTQQTFINAWRRLESFRGNSRFRTWLHRIAVNEVLSAERREGRYRGVLAEYGAADDYLDALPGNGDLDLERAIAALPARGRQVFILHAVYGYQHDETAALMGIAVGTSKAHYHRARGLLMDSLQQEEAIQ